MRIVKSAAKSYFASIFTDSWMIRAPTFHPQTDNQEKRNKQLAK